jgi:prepilin-type processing-associated H-X9-DG protein
MAILSYIQDYDEMYPAGDLSKGTTLRNSRFVWFRQIDPYLKDRNIYACPNASGELYQYVRTPLDYQVNRHIIRVGAALNVSAVDTPSTYLLVGEAGRGVDNYQLGAGDYETIRSNWATQENYRSGFTRHNGGMVITLADGHATWLRFPDTTAQNVADLGQLGDALEGTPMWGDTTRSFKAYLRRVSDGTAASGF